MQNDLNLTFADRALFAKVAQLMIDGFVINGSRPFEENEVFADLVPQLVNPGFTIANALSDLIPRWERFKDFPEEALNSMVSAEVLGLTLLLSQDITPKGLSGTQRKLLLLLKSRLDIALLVEEAEDNNELYN